MSSEDVARQAAEHQQFEIEQATRLFGGWLWSKCRTLLSQGHDIAQDYASGKYKSYEEYSNRLDAAARERTCELEPVVRAALAPCEEAIREIWWEARRRFGIETEPGASMLNDQEVVRFLYDRLHAVVAPAPVFPYVSARPGQAPSGS